MKKMILVTTKNEVSVLNYPVRKPGDYMKELRGFYKAISCDCIEIVRPKYTLRSIDDCKGLVMVIDEEGLMNLKQVNIIGSLFYGTPVHGHPIVGDILFMVEEMSFDGPALAGLDEERAEAIANQIRALVNHAKKVGVG